MRHRIEFSAASENDLKQLRLFDQRRIVEEISKQLAHSPETETRNRKCLGDDPEADFGYEPPLWELRIGEFRVFYDVGLDEPVVYVHAVRRKPPRRTTAEVLNEADDD